MTVMPLLHPTSASSGKTSASSGNDKRAVNFGKA